ncbi:MAG TPA: alpha-L-arabinofuranosidase C-terminal domain-containing protein, partial [Verrucomicrobiae bacterium]
MASHLNAVPAFTIDASRPAGKVSPRLYGLMTEEINHGYDGGLYAELIQNRAFMDDTNAPVHWSVVSGRDSGANIALDPANPLNDKLTTSLRLNVSNAAKGSPAGVANEGYWGFPVQPKTTYHAAIWVKAAASGLGPMTLSIVSEDGSTVYAAGRIPQLGTSWNHYEVTLKTGNVTPTDRAKFTLTLEQPGTVWLGLVSLFPPTWNDRPNGLRKDLMQMLVDLKPKFLRFPGGNYLEGNTIDSRFEWKKTLGPIEQRAGHMCPWGYRSSDGMGLMEFLRWSEDMGAEPVLAVYAGYSLDGKYVKAGPDLEPYVQDALDEIEYVIGDTDTAWGAQRAKDGHPAPFNLHYVEVGNEDWFDKAKTYDARYTQFHDAIRAKYPQLKLISTIANDQPEDMRVRSRKPDMLDEHYYSATDEFLEKSRTYGQNMDRSGPEVFVGEWAAHEDAAIKPWEPGARKQPPTPTMKAAIGDAVFMAAMERNSDIIKMHCYAPLLVNVNPGARQWRPDLIGYNAISSYGSPSYYTIQMFSRNVGDEILQVNSEEKEIQGCATRDSKTGEIFIKLVNPGMTNVVVKIKINGVASLASKGTAITLQGSPEDTNSIN